MTGVRVKPLVWTGRGCYFRGEGPEGSLYGVCEIIPGRWFIDRHSNGSIIRIGESRALDAAKAAAQADYDTRILAALEPQDSPAMAEELVALRAALEDLRKSAALLQQNAEGCAVNHYGADFAAHGMPGWLADTAASIARATAALTPEAKS